MAIALRTCKNDDGTRKLLLCMSKGEYYINAVDNGNTETLIGNIESLEEIKKIYLNMVWELIN